MSPLHIVFIRTHLIFHKLRNYHSPSILYSLGIYACIAALSALFHRYPSPVGISKQAEGLCMVRYTLIPPVAFFVVLAVELRLLASFRYLLGLLHPSFHYSQATEYKPYLHAIFVSMFYPGAFQMLM